MSVVEMKHNVYCGGILLRSWDVNNISILSVSLKVGKLLVPCQWLTWAHFVKSYVCCTKTVFRTSLASAYIIKNFFLSVFCCNCLSDDRPVRDLERKAALMHFGTNQAALMSGRVKPNGNHDQRPNPRVEHVKSLARTPFCGFTSVFSACHCLVKCCLLLE